MKTIEHYEKIIKEAQQGIEELKGKEQIDFSKFIGRYGDTLVIKGKKLLKSIGNGDINYNNINKNDYNKLVTFREATLSDLEKGDIFILKEDISNQSIEEFNIFLGKDNDGYYRFQYICNEGGIEFIENTIYNGDDTEILIFNRD